jgi:hypothetical protein
MSVTIGKDERRPVTLPTKAGWTVREWAYDTGVGASRTFELIAAKRLDSVKFGTTRIITTPPAEFLASLKIVA